MDSFGKLVDSLPAEIEIKRLAGTIVWLFDAEHEWTGAAQEALALLVAAAPDAAVWTVLEPAA